MMFLTEFYSNKLNSWGLDLTKSIAIHTKRNLREFLAWQRITRIRQNQLLKRKTKHTSKGSKRCGVSLQSQTLSHSHSHSHSHPSSANANHPMTLTTTRSTLGISDAPPSSPTNPPVSLPLIPTSAVSSPPPPAMSPVKVTSTLKVPPPPKFRPLLPPASAAVALLLTWTWNLVTVTVTTLLCLLCFRFLVIQTLFALLLTQSTTLFLFYVSSW